MYAIVMNPASRPMTTALRITTSMSNNRYRSTDTPIATGISPNVAIETFCSRPSHPGDELTNQLAMSAQV